MPQHDLVIYESKLELDGRLEKFSFQETGLVITGDISFDEWSTAVETLALLEMRSTLMFAWNWGGLIAHGSQRWGKYKEALIKTGLSQSTLENYKWVEQNTPREVRGIPGLAFSHYLKVAKVKDFDKKLNLLLQAANNKWAAEGANYARAIKLAYDGDPANQAQRTSPPPPTSRDWLPLATPGDELFEAEQKQNTLENKNSDLMLQFNWLAGQAERAISLLDLIEDDWAPDGVAKVVSEVTRILRAIPNDRALTLVGQVIDQFRQGDTSAMVDSLGLLSDEMGGKT